MRAKRIIGMAIILAAVLTLAIVSIGCQNLTASFRITDWEQPYYGYSHGWSDYVTIYYEVENTGNVEIDYYEVHYIVSCIDGTKHYGWTNGNDIDGGDSRSSYDMIKLTGNIASNEVISVKIGNWKLAHYGVGSVDEQQGSGGGMLRR